MHIDTLISQIDAYLQDNYDTYLTMLQKMVGINSYTGNIAGIKQLAEFTAAQFAPLGFTPHYHDAYDPVYGQHLVLTKEGKTAQTVAFVTHLDTVFTAEEERINNFHWRPEGNKLYGPGTVDIKGGTVLIYMLLSAIKHTAPTLFHNTRWVILCDSLEETSGIGFRDLTEQYLDPEQTAACLVFEGGRRRQDEYWIVTARKGMAVFELLVHGRAAHAGAAPHHGANAVVQLAELIPKIHAFNDPQRDLTFNVGPIEGGTVVNRVPHFARAEIEMRAFDAQAYQDGLNQMLALNGYSSVKSPIDGFPCRVEVNVYRSMPAWPPNPATNKLAAIWEEACHHLGFICHHEHRGGLSDGNHIWDYVPTLDGLGPHGNNAHCSERTADGTKDQEYATADSFIPKTILNTLSIINLLTDDN
ncbi:MAG TPA: M20/M25/M40 family metallo-hydrolase [Anaerolineae bacterium]|nr:M20/M25/M40 family metallo-hydrolase [Anaerolineae bacterium]